MNLFTFVVHPLEFCVESDCATPDDALREALKLGTPQEVLLWNYLAKALDEYPDLDSVECIDVDKGC